jgi:hypothetical protein
MSIARLMQMAAAGAGEDTDPFFNQTTLLLHGDGTNGAQNNTFLDSSTNTFTITRNGNTTQGTFSPFSLPNGEFSNFFDGSGDYLSFANGAFNLGNNDFVIESFFYILNYGGFQTIAGGNTDLATNAGASWNITILNSTGTVDATVYIGSTVYQIYVSTAVPLNAWNHIAFVRTGGRISLYLNGTRTDTLNTLSTGSVNNGSTTYPPCIAANGTGNQLEGYLSNVRIIAGATASGIYDANNTTITVPTAPLSSVANDIVLTCQSNRFVDNSGTPKTITVNGNTSVQPFSPFLPSAAYSPSVNGGSGYFDGTGDYLDCGNGGADYDFGSGDFTVECWFYPTARPLQHQAIAHKGHVSNNNQYDWRLYWGNTGGDDLLYWEGTGSLDTGSNKVLRNSWNHIAAVRSGANLYLYLNGTRASTSASGSMGTTYSNIYVGTANIGAAGVAPTNGYISGFNIIKGTAKYTAASITPPTAPSIAVSGTELLLLAQNAGIFDNTGKNNLETVGNAQIDTTVKKYGTGSMEFDGTGDYLLLRNSPELSFGAGAYTVEFWLNTTATGGWLIYKVVSDTGFRLAISGNGDGVTDLGKINLNEQVSNVSNNITSTSTINDGNWHHIAIVREAGSGTRIYIDGTSEAQQPAVYSFDNTGNMFVGVRESLGGVALNGYIDDLRITKGVARYTTTFTPPTAAFPDL